MKRILSSALLLLTLTSASFAQFQGGVGGSGGGVGQQGTPGITINGIDFNTPSTVQTAYPSIPYDEMRLWDSATSWAYMASGSPAGSYTGCPGSGTAGTNPASACYNWTALDTYLAAAFTNNVANVMLTIAQTPRYIATNNTDATCGYTNVFGNPNGVCTPPSDIACDGTGTNQTFKDFLTALGKHITAAGYSNTHKLPTKIEGWNEGNNVKFWDNSYITTTLCNGSGVASPAQKMLARMVNDEIAVLPTYLPGVKFTSPSWTSSSNGPDICQSGSFCDTYYSLFPTQATSILAVHAYKAGPDGVSPADCAATTTSTAPTSNNFVWITLENTSWSSSDPGATQSGNPGYRRYISGNTIDAPFINSLLSQGTYLTNLYSNVHSSWPAWIYQVTGKPVCSAIDAASCTTGPLSVSPGPTTCNGSNCLVNEQCFGGNNIGRQVLALGKTVNFWSEGMQSDGDQQDNTTATGAKCGGAAGTPVNGCGYKAGHNPLRSMTDFSEGTAIGSIPNNCPVSGRYLNSKRTATAADPANSQQQLLNAISAGTQGNFAYITPDMGNGMHGMCCNNPTQYNLGNGDGSILAADNFVKKIYQALQAKPAFQAGGDGVLLVSWDEGNISGAGNPFSVATDNLCNPGSSSCPASPAGSYGGSGGGHVGAIFVGPGVAVNNPISTTYHFADLLATISAITGVAPANFPGDSFGLTPIPIFQSTSQQRCPVPESMTLFSADIAALKTRRSLTQFTSIEMTEGNWGPSNNVMTNSDDNFRQAFMRVIPFTFAQGISHWDWYGWDFTGSPLSANPVPVSSPSVAGTAYTTVSNWVQGATFTSGCTCTGAKCGNSPPVGVFKCPITKGVNTVPSSTPITAQYWNFNLQNPALSNALLPRTNNTYAVRFWDGICSGNRLYPINTNANCLNQLITNITQVRANVPGAKILLAVGENLSGGALPSDYQAMLNGLCPVNGGDPAFGGTGTGIPDGIIEAFEPWNEPTTSQGGTFTGLTPAAAASAQQKAATTLRACWPSVKITSVSITKAFNFTGTPIVMDTAWTDSFLAAGGGGNNVDIWNMHVYGNLPSCAGGSLESAEDTVFTTMSGFQSYLNGKVTEAGKPLWVTEGAGNLNVTQCSRLADGGNTSDAQAIDYMRRTMMMAPVSGVDRMYFYAWDNGPNKTSCTGPSDTNCSPFNMIHGGNALSAEATDYNTVLQANMNLAKVISVTNVGTVYTELYLDSGGTERRSTWDTAGTAGTTARPNLPGTVVNAAPTYFGEIAWDSGYQPPLSCTNEACGVTTYTAPTGVTEWVDVTGASHPGSPTVIGAKPILSDNGSAVQTGSCVPPSYPLGRYNFSMGFNKQSTSGANLFQIGSMRLFNISPGNQFPAWNVIEPSANSFSWSTIDAWTTSYSGNTGQTLLWPLSRVPSFISSTPAGSCPDGNTGDCYPPTDALTTDATWKGFVQAAVNHAGCVGTNTLNCVKYFSIINEPNGGYFKDSANHAEYVQMFKDAAQIIHTTNPNLCVVTGDPQGGSTSLTTGSAGWLNSVLPQINGNDANGRPFVDIVAFHGYIGGSNPARSPSDATKGQEVNLSWIKQAMVNAGMSNKFIWNTEYTADSGASGVTTDIPDSGGNTLDQFVAQDQIILYENNVTNTFWYEPDIFPIATDMSLYTDSTYTVLNAAGKAWNTVTGWLTGTQPVGGTCSHPGTTWTCVFLNTSTNVQFTAAWDTTGANSLSCVGFKQYTTLLGVTTPCVGTVALSRSPVWLQSGTNGGTGLNQAGKSSQLPF